MPQPDGVVIVGAGQAGLQAAVSLRDEGWQGRITLVGEEPDAPYQRPPLSKGLLTGKTSAEQVTLRAASFYPEQRLGVLLGHQVSDIDRAERRLSLSRGPAIRYEHLILATGARPRPLAIPGADLEGVLSLRTLEDARQLMSRLATARRLVVIGAGFIGLEVAVAARQLGLQVEVLEVTDQAMPRAVCARTAAHFSQALADLDVQLRFNTAAQALLGVNGRVVAVQTSTGDSLPADVVVVGVGVQPNEELAAQCGLATAGGILVDEFLRTSDPHISAIGDCARFPSDAEAGRVRIESVQNAVDQARCVAARLAGRPAPYQKTPWFWSDQGANRLQIAGLAQSTDDIVVRGSPASGKFSVFRFRAARLTAVESVNRVADHMTARKLLAHPGCLTRSQAEDLDFDLASALPAPSPLVQESLT